MCYRSDELTLEVMLGHNTVKRIKEGLRMSKAELAGKAGLSPLTIDRIEEGCICRIETKRKIIMALGMNLSEKDKISRRLKRNF